MLVVNVEQGSRQWEHLRLGIATGSAFGKIVTPSKLQYAAGAKAYLHDLLAEWATGHAFEEFKSHWAERGIGLEPQARQALSFKIDADIHSVGFVYRDDEKLVGCSPDGFVHDDDGNPVAGVELKCPAAKTHIGYMLDPASLAKEYKMQVHGGLWVTQLPVWHLMSFYPGMPAVVIRVEPDEKVQNAFDNFIPEFLDQLKRGRAKLLEMGVKPRLTDETPEWALPSVDGLDQASLDRAMMREAPFTVADQQGLGE